MPGVMCLRMAHALRHHPYLAGSYLAHGSPVPPMYYWRQRGHNIIWLKHSLWEAIVPQELQRQKAKPDQDVERVYMLSLPAPQRQPSEMRGELSVLSLPGTLGREVCWVGHCFPGGISAEEKRAVTPNLLPKHLRVAEGIFSSK